MTNATGVPDLSNDAGWPADLSATHRAYLAQRGVSPEVAAGRGYRTVDSQNGSNGNNLSNYGWGAASPVKQQINRTAGAAALVIPLYHHDSDIPSTYQARLDTPRIKDGRRLKYEMNHGVKRGTEPGNLPADVHPFRHADVEGTDIPLIITEGIPKADAILTAALAEGIDVAPVALTGVTMGYEAYATGDSQQTTERKLAEMLRVICDGRSTVYLCWDSDWADKKDVRNSLARTGEMLESAGVGEVVYLGVPKPTDGDSDKAGVDDWLAQGNKLADLLVNRRMPAPTIEAKDRDQADQYALPTFEIDFDEKVMWAFEMRRIGNNPKPEPVREVKLGAIARIVQVISGRRIVDHELVEESDTFRIHVEWIERSDNGPRHLSRELDVPAEDFADVTKWLSADAGTARILTPTSRGDERYVANTIAALSAREDVDTVLTTGTTGWFWHRVDERADGEPAGWRYIHGQGWIGSAEDQSKPGQIRPMTSASASVETDSNAQMTDIIVTEDYDADKAAWVQWYEDWVLGGITDRLQAEDPICKLETKADQTHAEALRLRMAFGAMVVARSLLPGPPAKGTPFLEGRPASGKTLQARVWTSCFGPFFADKPFASLNSTAAGVEVMLTDARNMAVLVDDFHPGTQKDMETMNKIVDTIARGAYDGAVKSRSTRDLRTMAAPQIAGSIVLTGEELPNQSSASNSTIQRLLVMRVRSATEPIYQMMNRLNAHTVPQRTATGFMVAELARRLNAASAGATKTEEVTGRLTASLAELALSLSEETISRTKTENAAAPSDRSIMAMNDLLYGGALILSIGQQLGILNTPKKMNAAVRALTNASSKILTETARAVSDTSPARNVAELITAALTGKGHVTNTQGACPSDEGALSWGWNRQPDSSWRASGERIGWVTHHEGQAVVALSATALAAAMRSVTGSRDFTKARLPQMLAEAIDDDAKPILAFGSDAPDPMVRLRVNGHTQSYLLVRPEAIGVNTKTLAAPTIHESFETETGSTPDTTTPEAA